MEHFKSKQDEIVKSLRVVTTKLLKLLSRRTLVIETNSYGCETNTPFA